MKLEKLGFLSQNRKVTQSNCLIRDRNLFIFGGDSARTCTPLFAGETVFSNTLEIFNLKKAEDSIFSSARARAFGIGRSGQQTIPNSFSNTVNLDFKN